VRIRVTSGGRYHCQSGARPLVRHSAGNQDLGEQSGRSVVSPRVAHGIARRSHVGQHNRFGERVLEHLERVAAAVPVEARTTAWLHDLFELTPVDRTQLRARGLTEVEELALELLTRRTQEPYDAHVVRIADAPGSAGRIARMVKLADLDDHLAHSRIPPDAPPYAWARRRILANGGVEPRAAAAAYRS
jgi:hypothetical protein